MRLVIAALSFALVCTGQASGQSWESPTFFSPRPAEDIGVYLIQPDGDDLGFAGIWRQSGNINLGVRAGLTGDLIHLGGEFFNALDVLGSRSPVLVSWVFGFGASFDDEVTWLRVPLGVSAGIALDAGATTVTPYVHPRLALDFVTTGSGDDEESDTEINLPVDVGADIALGESLVLRVGATFEGGRSTFGAGAAYRMSRRLVVR